MQIQESYTYDIPISNRKVVVLVNAGIRDKNVYCERFIFYEEKDGFISDYIPKIAEIDKLKEYINFIGNSDSDEGVIEYMLEQYGLIAARNEILGKMVVDDNDLLRLNLTNGFILIKDSHSVTGLVYLNRKKPETLDWLAEKTMSTEMKTNIKLLQGIQIDEFTIEKY